jgi:hypothetical protein
VVLLQNFTEKRGKVETIRKKERKIEIKSVKYRGTKWLEGF